MSTRLNGRASGRLACTAVLTSVMLTLGACATGRAVRSGQAAAQRGDWDAAVAYYRDALGRDPTRIDVKVALQRAMTAASTEHAKRGHDLEAQDQLAGAAAEYRLAADLEPGNTIVLTKALELDKRIRDQVEASRPKPQIDQLRQQAAQSSGIAHLDPRIRVPKFSYNGNVKELLNVIGAQTGIAVRFDQAVTPTTYQITADDSSLEEVLNQVLTENSLTYKVINSKTIFVYKDDQQSRQKYDDQYAQLFYVSNVDTAEIVTVLSSLTQAQTGSTVRPTVTLIKSANAVLVKATEPVMKVIASIIDAADRPKAEVLIDVEILEVNRTRIRQLGVDLSQYAVGLTVSPEVAPPNTATSPNTFPTQAPPFNLNTVSQGLATNNFYVTAPSILIRALEQDSKTRILAKPELRGREGSALTLNLGSSVPIPQTQFQAAGAGGVANQPVTQIAYKDVGINLAMTPRVTYQDEIILDTLTIDDSSIGPDVDVDGVPTISFISRKAAVTMRLRDGESNLLAGLVSDSDSQNYHALPGLSNIPILRNIFGNGNNERDQTDIVMIVTPHILRGHEMTAANLKPMYIGTGQNFGASTPPTLISPDVPIQQPTGVPPGVPVAGATTPSAPPLPGTGASSISSSSGAPPASSATSSSNPRVVAIEPVPSTPAPPPAPSTAQLVVSVPTTTMQVGGPAYTVPLTITGVQQLGTLTMTITYDPAVLRADVVNQGTFMQQGGVTPTFAPKIDAAKGRIDVAMSRPAGSNGASGTGFVAGIAFQAIAPGTTTISATAVALTTDGKSVPVQTVPANVTVK